MARKKAETTEKTSMIPEEMPPIPEGEQDNGAYDSAAGNGVGEDPAQAAFEGDTGEPTPEGEGVQSEDPGEPMPEDTSTAESAFPEEEPSAEPSEQQESGEASSSADEGFVGGGNELAEATSTDLGENEEGAARDGEDYGRLLKEVSSMGLSNGGDEPPLTLADAEELQDNPPASSDSGGELSEADRALMDEGEPIPETEPATPEPTVTPERRRTARRQAAPRRDNRILTIDAHDEVQSEEDREAALWHDIQNAYRTRRILTGTLDSVERTEAGMTVAVVSYNGFRVVIPHKEMLL